MMTSGEGQAAPPNTVADTGVSAAGAFAEADAAERGSLGAPVPRLTRNSLLRYSPAVVLVAILIADSNRHTDPDLWGHIRFGQAFIASRHLIDRDPYSYSAAGNLWRDHEWLAEVVMAAVYNAAGVVGLKLWKFFFTALTVLFIADTETETGAPPSIQLQVLLVASVGLILQTQFRPQMFTLVCLSALLALLARDNYRRNRTIWLAVPLMALWANLHGGFVAGIVTLALYTAVAALSDFAAGAGLRRAIRLGLVTLAATAATLVNPYGIGMWKAVVYALRNPYTRSIVNDWQPLTHALATQWHQGPSGVLIYLAVIGLIAAFAATFVASPRAGDLPLVAIAAFMSIEAFQSVRNMALAVIALSGPLARHLAVLSERRRGGAPAPDSRPVNQWLMLAVCGLLMIQGGVFSSRLAEDEPLVYGPRIRRERAAATPLAQNRQVACERAAYRDHRERHVAHGLKRLNRHERGDRDQRQISRTRRCHERHRKRHDQSDYRKIEQDTGGCLMPLRFHPVRERLPIVDDAACVGIAQSIDDRLPHTDAVRIDERRRGGGERYQTETGRAAQSRARGEVAQRCNGRIKREGRDSRYEAAMRVRP
jgi:hypothetical protein